MFGDEEALPGSWCDRGTDVDPTPNPTLTPNRPKNGQETRLRRVFCYSELADHDFPRHTLRECKFPGNLPEISYPMNCEYY